MAEYYSAELSEKVIRGHTENALKSKYNGGTPTFGYVIDKDMQYQIDPRTAPAVLEMFTMYDKGATMKEIVAYMSERGVTTVRGKKIDLNFMARLLKMCIRDSPMSPPSGPQTSSWTISSSIAADISSPCAEFPWAARS